MITLDVEPIDLILVLDKCTLDVKYAKSYYNCIRALNLHEDCDTRFAGRVDKLGKDFGDRIVCQYTVDEPITDITVVNEP